MALAPGTWSSPLSKGYTKPLLEDCASSRFSSFFLFNPSPMEDSNNLLNEINKERCDCSFHERSPRIFNYVPAVIHEAAIPSNERNRWLRRLTREIHEAFSPSGTGLPAGRESP